MRSPVTSTETGSLTRETSVSIAAPSPRVSVAGRIPWASSRSSSFARSACSSASSTSSPAGSSRSSRRASLSAMTVWTRLCWAPSWRSRSIRRRVSSAVATTRAREAASSARLWALAIAVAISSVNCAMRSSVPGGSGSGRFQAAIIAPHTRAPTITGTRLRSPSSSGTSPLRASTTAAVPS